MYIINNFIFTDYNTIVKFRSREVSYVLFDQQTKWLILLLLSAYDFRASRFLAAEQCRLVSSKLPRYSII